MLVLMVFVCLREFATFDLDFAASILTPKADPTQTVGQRESCCSYVRR